MDDKAPNYQNIVDNLMDIVATLLQRVDNGQDLTKKGLLAYMDLIPENAR